MSEEDRAAKAARAKAMLKKRQQQKKAGTSTPASTIEGSQSPARVASPAPALDMQEGKRDISDVFDSGHNEDWMASLPRAKTPPILPSTPSTPLATISPPPSRQQNGHADSKPNEALNNRITYLESENGSLTSRIAELEQLQNDSNSALAEERTKHSNLQTKVSVLQSEMNEARKSEKSSQEALKKKISFVETENASLTQQIKKLSDATSDTESHLAREKAETSRLKGELFSLNSTIAALSEDKSRLEPFEAQFNDAASSLETERTRLADLQAELESARTQSEATLQNERQTINILVSEKSALSAELTRLQNVEDELRDSSSLFEQERQRTSALTVDVNRLQHDHDEATRSLTAARSELQSPPLMNGRKAASRHERREKELEEHIQSDDRAEKLEASLKNTQDRADELEFQLSKLKQTYTTLKADRDTMESQVKAYEASSKEWQAKHGTLDQHLSAQTKQLDQIQAEKQDVLQQMEQLKKAHAEAVRGSEQDVTSLKANLLDLQTELENAKAETATRRVEDAEKMQKDLQSEGSSLMQSLNEMRPKIVQLTGEKLELTEKIDELEKLIRGQETSALALEASLDETRAHNAELAKQLDAVVNAREQERATGLEDSSQLQTAYAALQRDLESAHQNIKTLEARSSQVDEGIADEGKDFLERSQEEVEFLRQELAAKTEELEELRDSMPPQSTPANRSLDDEMLSSITPTARNGFVQRSVDYPKFSLLEDKASSTLSPQTSRPSSRARLHRPMSSASSRGGVSAPVARIGLDLNMSPATQHKRKVSLAMLRQGWTVKACHSPFRRPMFKSIRSRKNSKPTNPDYLEDGYQRVPPLPNPSNAPRKASWPSTDQYATDAPRPNYPQQQPHNGPLSAPAFRQDQRAPPTFTQPFQNSRSPPPPQLGSPPQNPSSLPLNHQRSHDLLAHVFALLPFSLFLPALSAHDLLEPVAPNIPQHTSPTSPLSAPPLHLSPTQDPRRSPGPEVALWEPNGLPLPVNQMRRVQTPSPRPEMRSTPSSSPNPSRPLRLPAPPLPDGMPMQMDNSAVSYRNAPSSFRQSPSGSTHSSQPSRIHSQEAFPSSASTAEQHNLPYAARSEDSHATNRTISDKEEKHRQSDSSEESDPMNAAFKAAYSKAPKQGKKQEKVDRYLDNHSGTVDAVNAFCATNAAMLGIAASIQLGNLDSSVQEIDSALSGLGACASVVTDGLNLLATVYPPVAVVAAAFHVAGLVKLQLQDTVCILFELRNIKDPEEKGPDGQKIGGRIQGLVEIMAKDIKMIGNGCDAYLAKGTLAKTMKANKYLERLSSYISLLKDHKANLEFAINAHTARGVDSANEKLDDQKLQLKSLEDKMDLLFKKLDTPRERELNAFITEKGGASRCVGNNTLLEALVTKSGETLSSLSGGRGNSKDEELASVKKMLQKELSESVDEAFTKNMALFEGKLQLTENRIKDHVTSESDRIINALQGGAHSRIVDQDIQDIWKDMGWKGSSVKARHFVLALHDFFTDRLAKQSATQENSATDASQKRDRWALSYINVAHVQAIQENVDDDVTGFITIQEVNNFVSDRPKGWSLPYWLAYWAVGWHASITRYRNMIYGLIQKMFGLLDRVIPPNRQGVNEYLMNQSIWRLELILRATTPAAAMEEERLERNLEPLLYLIESPATVPLVCGPAIFKHTDADVSARLANYAFGMTCNESLVKIHFPPGPEFGAFTNDDEDLLRPEDIPHNILKLGIKNEVDFSAFSAEKVLPVSKVRHPINGVWTGHLYQVVDGDYVSTQGLVQIAVALTKNYRIEGGGESYSGLLSFSGSAKQGYRYSLDVEFNLTYPDGFQTKCTGMYDPANETIQGNWVVVDESGEVIPSDRSSDGGLSDLGLSRQPSRFGAFEDEDSVTDQLLFTPDALSFPSLQTFKFTRTAPWLQRFRPPRREFEANPVKARWKFACQAVSHEVNRNSYFWAFFQTRFAERRRVVDLTLRSKIFFKGYTIAPEDALTDEDREELSHYRRILNPGDARFYSTLADIEMQKLPWHIGYNCDACERELIKSRSVCITCINETFSDQVDLCTGCSNAKVSVRGFAHEPSHSLLRTEQVLHDHLLAKTIRDARAITERTKEYFRIQERRNRSTKSLKKAGAHEAFQKGPAEAVRFCACCGKAATLPVWVCVLCTPDVLICQSCELQDVDPSPEVAPGHTRAHPLVSIKDSTSANDNVMSTDARIMGLEKRLANLETNFEDRISTMEKRVEQRLSGMEAVLKQIAASLVASSGNRTAQPQHYQHGRQGSRRDGY
ncbi:hypothetical protein DL96DRAFT_1702640 [Flagelloscypha sp. PMI_526]|nr:hypothetical protein DL96DRAFT_1702640 [Flagelloscypha sp. PMI_526]